MTTPGLIALRAELADLLSQLDRVELPAPDSISNEHNHPGPEWLPADRWIIRAIDTADGRDCVYAETPDSFGGDMIAVSIEHARRIGMAWLAAAQWAADHREPVRFHRPKLVRNL